MRFGLYLKGGGAKGAFQAGLLCSLWQRGVTYSVIAGTSIGAVNGWYVLHNAYKELEELYLNLNEQDANKKLSGKFIDNSFLIDKLRPISGTQDPRIDAFYINYCQGIQGKLVEKIENIKGKDPEYALERISRSSQLPYNSAEMTVQQFVDSFDAQKLEEQFNGDVQGHVYDGLNLDGGMLNNILIRNVFSHPGERIICIGYNGTREEYLENLSDLAVSERERIIYIASDQPFDVTDTYNFTPEFLKARFKEGYKKGMDFPVLQLTSR